MDLDSIIPKKSDHITKSWILKNTGLNAVAKTISVIGNIQVGVGFLSNLCRVSFKTEEGTDENILVKLLPDSKEYRALTIDQKFDKIEINFYSLVHPEILKVSPELEVNFCKYYGGKFIEADNLKDYASMIIIEDLKPAGYQMLNPECDNWKVNLEKVVVFLAKFHVAGFEVEKSKNQKIPQLFPFCMGVDDTNLNLFLQLAVSSSARLIEILKQFGCTDDIMTSYMKLSQNTEEIMIYVLKKGAEFPGLIHGDLWPPNVMVTERNEDPIKVIDFQLLGYRDPTYELTPVILTCMPKKNLEPEVIEDFARLYYKQVSKICEKKKLGNMLERSEEEFIQFFNTWGMTYAYIWFLLSIDSFPNDIERVYDAFILLHEKYKIADILG